MDTSHLFTGLYYTLWVGQPIFQIGVAVVLLQRRLHKEFPFFFKYLILQGATNLLLFAFAFLTHYRAYFYTYWTLSAVSTVLEFGIIYEIFGQLFRPYPYLRDFARVVIRWAGSLLLLIAILLALTASAREEPILVAVLWAERSIRLVQCGLVFFLLWFCSYLGITRRHYLFGIALGFGTIASTELGGIAARMMTGYIGDRGLNVVLLAAADFAAIVWLIYLLSRAPVPKDAEAPVLSGQKWDQGVAELLYPQAEPGLLARIDRMVEDAFAHSREAKTIAAEAAAQAPATIPPPTSGR